MPKAVWKVVGYDTFAREEYPVGEYPTREAAEAAVREIERRSAAHQDEALRDQVWIVPPEGEAETEQPGA